METDLGRMFERLSSGRVILSFSQQINQCRPRPAGGFVKSRKLFIAIESIIVVYL